VGHVDEGDADLFLEGLQLDLEGLAQLGVQGAQRLVQEQDLGVEDQGPGQGHPLLLPSRQLRGAPSLHAGQPHAFERGQDHASSLLLGDAPVREPEGHVVEHIEMREQRVVLEHGVDVALVRRRLDHVHPVQQDGPLRGALEPRDQPERRGLAAAGWAE